METLPLHGIKVVEFTHMVMGPAVGAILTELGAEVIKVEAIGGDATRRLLGSGAGYFPMYNRGKASICIDLKSAAGAGVAKRLAASADIVVENFRPGAMDRLGLGYEALRALNPRLIFASEKGFLAGPYEDRTALDEVAQMMGGLAYMTGPPGRPLRAGASVIDVAGGMFGVIGVLAALNERHRTGRGQEVQSALFENCALLAGQHMQQFAMTGMPPAPMPSRISVWSVYDIFTLALGEQLFIGAVSDRQFETLCKVLNCPELLADPRFASNASRVEARPDLLARLAEALELREIGELSAKLEAAGLPYAPIVRPDQLFDDPHLKESGGLAPMVTDDGSQTEVVLLPLLMAGRRLGVRRPLPGLGEHTAEVLAMLEPK